MGVVEHKQRKNEACSRGLLERYATTTTSAPGSTPSASSSRCLRPAGVILALTPSTNPIASVYFKVLLALMTRNAVVVSPHPMARKVPRRGGQAAGRAATAAGAPDGVIQVVEEPTIPLIEALMADPAPT